MNVWMGGGIDGWVPSNHPLGRMTDGFEGFCCD